MRSEEDETRRIETANDAQAARSRVAAPTDEGVRAEAVRTDSEAARSGPETDRTHYQADRAASDAARGDDSIARGSRFVRWLRTAARSPSVRAACFAFAVTRLVIFALFVLTAKFEVTHPDPRGDYGETRLDIAHVQFARIMRKRTNVADSNWYLGIAAHGYERRPFSTERPANWAFFPAYPLALRAASLVTREMDLTGVALSTLFFLFALFIFHKLALAYGFTLPDASRAVFYLAAFPVSYFFSAPLTESLFLLATVASFYAAKRERWLVAGLCGALASGTRSTGVLLLPALAILYFETYRTLRPRRNFLPLLLVPAGLAAFMLFLYMTTGDALAFKDILVTWGRAPRFFLLTLFDYLRDPLLLADAWDFRLLNFVSSIGALACGIALARRRLYSLAAYTLLAIFVALSSGALQSQARYALVLFPAFLPLAVWGRSPRVDQIVRTAFLILLTLMTIFYSEQLTIALS